MWSRGDTVEVGLCLGEREPQKWVPGTVVAQVGPTVAVVLWDNWNNGGRDWIGPIVYVRKR